MRQTAFKFGGSVPDTLPLYDFQQEALQAVLKARERGVTKQVVSIPTGGGKTVLACHLIRQVGLPTVFMVHRDELAKQTIDKLALFDPSITTAVCKAERGREVYELAGRDVVVASAQTLAHERRLQTLLNAVGPNGFMVVDEAHHSAAPSWRRAIEAMDPQLLVGLSATPKRGDGQRLDDIFEDIVYSVPMLRLVERGLLARPIGIRIGTTVDLDGVSKRQGDFALNELELAVNTPERNALVVDAWEKHAADRHHTIAFCVDVDHTFALAEMFNERGIAAAAIVGSTPADERERIFKAFREGEIKVITNCMVLTEGFDEPKANCALMCRPTQSQSLYIQMAGRVLRKADKKPDALILDFVDLTQRHKLQSILTLAGDDARELKPKEGDDEPLDLFAEVGEAKERVTRIRRDSERVGDLLGASPFVWQHAGERMFVPAGPNQWVAIVQTEEGWLPARLIAPQGEAPKVRPLFARPLDLTTAMSVAEREVPQNALTHREAGWRSREEQITPGQIKAANFLRLKLPEHCTKAEASQLLDRGFFERAFRKSELAQLEVQA